MNLSINNIPQYMDPNVAYELHAYLCLFLLPLPQLKSHIHYPQRYNEYLKSMVEETSF